MTIFPSNGDNPFFLRIGGLQFGNALLDSITATNDTKGLAVPYGYVYSGTSVFNLNHPI
jgi:hypothetical protein